MRASVLAFFILSAFAALSEAGDQEKLKVCGPDFIKAVIFTCGASRWKKDLKVFEDGVEGKNFLEVSKNYGTSDDTMDHSLFYLNSPDQDIHMGKHLSVGIGQRRKRDPTSKIFEHCCKKGCTLDDFMKLC